MIHINLSQTLQAYYDFCEHHNRNKPLTDQIRTERNTGHLLLVLLCHELAKKAAQGSVLNTYLKSLATRTGQCKKTVRNHLRILQHVGVILTYGAVGKNYRYRIEFNPKLIQYTDAKNVDNLLISEENLVDNLILQMKQGLQRQDMQVVDNVAISNNK